MQPFHYHVFICDQKKPEGVPCCPARGSAETLNALRKEVAARGLLDEVQITTCGSLGLCERGPNLVVYPDGVWYSGVRPEDVPELVESHFLKGQPLIRLANRDEAEVRAEILLNRAKFMAAQRAKEASGALPDDLNQTLRAYMESRALLTALELDVFTAVGSGATADEVARKIATHARATEMLLNALAAMGMLAKQEGVFRNSPDDGALFRGRLQRQCPPRADPHGEHLASLVEPDGLCARGDGGGPSGNGRPWRRLDRAVHRCHAPQRVGARAASGEGGRGRGGRTPAGRGRRLRGLLHRLRPSP